MQMGIGDAGFGAMVVVRAFVVNQKGAGFGIERESFFILPQVLAFELLWRHRQAFGKRCNILRIQSRRYGLAAICALRAIDLGRDFFVQPLHDCIDSSG
ncbi:hypothetical protein L6R21_22845 [bacterium]|nr:hypothetical protein [bacterium]